MKRPKVRFEPCGYPGGGGPVWDWRVTVKGVGCKYAVGIGGIVWNHLDTEPRFYPLSGLALSMYVIGKIRAFISKVYREGNPHAAERKGLRVAEHKRFSPVFTPTERGG